jgi:hypothetical protein
MSVKSFFKSLGDRLSKPFVDLYHGRFMDAMKDYFNTYTPYGLVNDGLDHIYYMKSFVTNQTKESVAVVTTANPDWVIGDFLSSVVQLCLTLGSDAPAGYEAIKSATNVFELVEATSALRSSISATSKLYELFAKNGVEVPAHGQMEVHRRPLANPLKYMSPSQYAACFGGSDISIMVTTKSGKSVAFNSNSNHSWIATAEGCRRARIDDPNVPDDSVAIHAWK